MRKFIIGLLIGATLVSLGWSRYTENFKNCYYAKGIKDYVRSVGTTTAREINIFWIPTELDYKACEMVGEDL